MSTYLGRLKSVLAENTPTPVTDKTDRSPPAPRGTATVATDKTDRSPFVSFVSEWRGGIFSQHALETPQVGAHRRASGLIE